MDITYTVTEEAGIFHYFENGTEFIRDIYRYNFVGVFTNSSGQVISKVSRTRRITGQKQLAQGGFTLKEVVAL